MTTAHFSNGFTDIYGGDRDVTVGWAIIEIATGVTHASGHSLDEEKARKTAAGDHYARAAMIVTGRDHKDSGWGDPQRRRKARAYNAETRRLAAPLLKIEVVAL